MGRLATGVRAISLEDEDYVVDVQKVLPGADVLAITERGMGKRTREDAYRLQHRGGKGIIVMALSEKTGDLAALKMCTGEEDVMLIRDDGTVIRMPSEQISVTVSRATSGVKLMNVPEGSRVASVAMTPKAEEEEGDNVEAPQTPALQD